MYEPLAMDKQSDCFFSAMASSFSITSIIITMATVILFRVLFVIYQTGKPHHHRDSQPLSTLIILGSGARQILLISFLWCRITGLHPLLLVTLICNHCSTIFVLSGGHTAEMLDLLSVLQKNRFKPRFYIAAATDNMSLQKARALENSLADMSEIKDVPQQFMQIYRSREVGQSYVTSVWTTLLALAHALWLMIKIRPQVVLCNGPGTCVPICVIAFLFKVVGIRWSSTFYVESIARVRRLSLSGLVLYKLRIADQIFVQWPQLKSKYPRAHYVGRLM
ncbi:UDP-N-acetylglucosamine transferase subunit ALG14 homolog isoform X1 [Carica papaya]|uniref:UDP-N-acetylglucosamine transferase subunit ALG14 homolog isoform X1 n=1 Tax=Carica papaya TaxID=3649 RepID=UPI000B8CEC6F|nr:UDP-N-acetylglucosamine transferase subunit ALG14 homolog isoform X1 [Carica papaya]XP_021891372.1 UDP-N-acetylglucosamine transferase subunit ALG14 homolog isoform X1 [Carica papaya]XP_021891373.1 UDP-N-acetylglucosamine transferase subunit ALG14 homolog isoform X1 [Carica papaya]